MTEKYLGQGNAKFILFGEHSVVYGARAIACGIPKGATAWLKRHDSFELRISGLDQVRTVVEPDSEGEPLQRAFAQIIKTCDVTDPFRVDVQFAVPSGSGLGSSAAMAVAIGRAMRGAFEIEPQTVVDAVSASERVFHENPSGVDETVSLRGGLLAYQIGVGPKPIIVENDSHWVLAQTGSGASTAEMVSKVKALRGRNEESFRHLVLSMEELAASAQTALQDHDVTSVGELMNMNHGLLAALGVSTATLDDACWFARDRGALGAKLTGAGGGGCIVALAESEERAVVIRDAFRKRAVWSEMVTIGES